MQNKSDSGEIITVAAELSTNFDYSKNETAIILAAGHGKRIKSHTSKMLHKIWEIPTVERVFNACIKGNDNINTILVVGIKAVDVMNVIGKRERNIYAYQEHQNGTGHAVQVGIEKIVNPDYNGIVYVLPGDMGLYDEQTMNDFRKAFVNSNNDMMVLTGLYEGKAEENYYGRIIRVKETDCNGNPSGADFGKVIEIIEYKDILSLSNSAPYEREFNGKKYCYTKTELIENNEYNSGVYAFKFNYLKNLVNELKNNNVQNEIYITDLIYLFNKSGLSVGAVSPSKQHVLMGFNNKSVLRQMDDIARNLVYEKLKDIIEITDPEDFFIDEEVIEDIIAKDALGVPLDIKIGKGVYVGKGVKLNYNLTLLRNVYLSGNIEFGENVTIHERVHLTTFENQTMQISNNVEILQDNMVKGNVSLGENTRIESRVNITGSDEFPLRVGKNVLIKGSSYIFGSEIEDDIYIEHSVIIKKKVEKLFKKNGEIQPVRFYLPMPEGLDAVSEIC